MSDSKNNLQERIRVDVLKALLKDHAAINVDPYVEQTMRNPLESYSSRALRVPSIPERNALLTLRNKREYFLKKLGVADVTHADEQQLYEEVEKEALAMFNDCLQLGKEYSGVALVYKRALANMVIVMYLHYTSMALYQTTSNSLIGNKKGLLTPRKDRVVATILDTFKQNLEDKKHIVTLKRTALSMYDGIANVVENYRR